jgi:PAS domain S-box-containing protein
MIMLQSLSEYFKSAQDEDPDFIRLVRRILIIVIFVNAGALILTSGLLGAATRNASAVVALSITLLLEIASFLRVLRGRLGMAKVVVPFSLIVALTIIALGSTGVHSVAVLTFPLIIIISTLLLGEKAAYTSTPLVILAVVLIAIGDLLGWNTSQSAQATGIEDIFLTSMLMLATSATLQLLTRRMNESLQQSRRIEQARYVHNLLDAALDAFITMNEQGNVLSWNLQAEKMFGWTAREAIGNPLASLIIPHAYREAHIRGLQHFLVTGEGPVLNKRTEITALNRDGREFPVELAIAPIEQDGKYTFTAFVRDITDRNQVESERSSISDRKRSQQFEAISRVAHTAASFQTLDELLLQITRLIGDQFGHYHIGIFLLDTNKEYAVLHAANSAGGQKMLEAGYSLKVGESGIIGYVSETGLPRIAVDVDMDGAFLSYPDLPETRSEMALPMRVAGELIGVLDAHSVDANAFTQADIQVFSTLADLVGIAIQNVRSIRLNQQLLAESQRVSSGYIQNTWQVLKSANDRIGYHFSATSLKQLDKPMDTPQILEAVRTGKVVATGGKKANLAVPIILRGATIGAIELRAPQGHTWDSDEIDIAQAVAERLSLAIETATVIESTQRRAALEQATSEMSSRISTSTRIDSILRTTAEELSRVLGGSDVLVQIQPTAVGLPAPEA